MPITPTDLPHLLAALSLARRGLGNTWPNPAVGCVIVKDGVVVGRGWTQPGGRPHAEVEALRRASAVDKNAARGATVYVTLEPCSHHGRTAPCAEALVALGVARVVAAIEDPDPRVSGRGLAMLRAAGVAVDLCDAPGQGTEAKAIAAKARDVTDGFLTRVRLGRPMVTLKLATSLDGRIATRTGDSKWITGEPARARGHLLRGRHDAVMVGIGTAMADDPRLDCRLPGWGEAGWDSGAMRQPVRLVADSQARLPLGLDLARRAGKGPGRQPTWLLARADADPARVAALQAAGVEVLPVPCAGGPAAGPPPDAALDLASLDLASLDLGAAFQALGAKGLTRVLVEGGGRLAAALLRAGLVDRMVWFRAPIVLGGDGVPAIAGLDVNLVAEASGFTRISAGAVGIDQVETYAVASGDRAG